MPVPADAEGNRKKAGWDFHYDKWYNADKTKFLSGASRQNPFPASRKGQLDYELAPKENGSYKDQASKPRRIFLTTPGYPSTQK
jgi:hypothetical protein